MRARSCGHECDNMQHMAAADLCDRDLAQKVGVAGAVMKLFNA